MPLSLFSLLLFSCAQNSKKNVPNDNLVHIDAAINHAYVSYLRGCVEARKEFTPEKFVFPICKEKAMKHRKEILSIINQPIHFE